MQEGKSAHVIYTTRHAEIETKTILGTTKENSAGADRTTIVKV
jgi:hypothetical protein